MGESCYLNIILKRLFLLFNARLPYQIEKKELVVSEIGVSVHRYRNHGG